MHAGESFFLNACTYTLCFLSCSPAVVYLLSLNRLCTLPKGFGAFACMEVLDLSYNNLNSESLPGNFFYMGEFYWHKPGFSTNVILFWVNPTVADCWPVLNPCCKCITQLSVSRCMPVSVPYWSLIVVKAIVFSIMFVLFLLHCVNSATLRALYLSDNDFDQIPDDICKLKNLQVVSRLVFLHFCCHFWLLAFCYRDWCFCCCWC